MTRSLRGRIQLSLVVAFIAILFTPLFACDYMVPGVTIDVVETGFAEGEPGQVTETSPYVPSRHFCAVNETPFTRDNWWYAYGPGLRRYVYLGTQGVTSVLLEVTFRALNVSCTLQFGSEDDIYNTTTAQPHEVKTLTFSQPIDDTEGWLYVFRALILTDSKLDTEVMLQSFCVWVSTDSDLCPVSFTLERTDGESLLGFARMCYREGEYYRYNPVAVDAGEGQWGEGYFCPWGENDTVYLKPGDYSAHLTWYFSFKQDISLSLAANSSVRCRIQIPVAQLNITSIANVPGYDVVVEETGYATYDQHVFRTGVERTAIWYVWPSTYVGSWVDLSTSQVGYLVFPHAYGHHRFWPNASANYDVSIQFHQPQFGSTLVVLQYFLLIVFFACLAVVLAAYMVVRQPRHASVSIAVKLGIVPVVLFVASLLLPWSTGQFNLGYYRPRPPLAVSEFTFPGLGTRMLFSDDSLLITGFLSREAWVPMAFWSLTLLMIAALLIRNRMSSLAVLSVLAVIGYIGESQGASWLLVYTMSTSVGPGPFIALLAVLSAIAGLSVVGLTSWFKDRQRSANEHGEGGHQTGLPSWV